MNISRLQCTALLTYILSVAIGIEAINSAWGHCLPIEDLFGEGSGAGKLRGARGEFQTVLFVFGTWVYPACVIVAARFALEGRETKIKIHKVLLFAGAALCLGVLARFCWLGVFTVGWGQMLGG